MEEGKRQVTIDVAALCDKAGRKANQDNFYLSCHKAMHQVETDAHVEYHGKGIALPQEGTLFVVADGMGGMNAGEVASQIVVDTLGREMSEMTGTLLSDTAVVAEVARRAVVMADKAIKQYVSEHPETAGTGSTVVLLWLLGSQAVVAWCGDSRCYRYNPCRGLEQLSHDHSYVQQLVDEGKLPPELAFGHDQSNIITRCLCDDKEPADPDVKVIDVYRDDMFLLCSDGLCGLLPDDVIEQLLKEADGDVAKGLTNCWQRGTAEGWSDNVSIILATVHGIDAVAPVRKVAPAPQRPAYTTVTVDLRASEAETKANQSTVAGSSRPKRKLVAIILIVLLLVGAVVWYFFAKHTQKDDENLQPVAVPEEIYQAPVEEEEEESAPVPQKTVKPKSTTPAKDLEESIEESEAEKDNDDNASLMQASEEVEQ